MSSVKDLENKILECVKHGDELIADYEKLVFEVRDLKKTVERLENDRMEMKRKIDSMAERVEIHLRARA